MGLDWLYSELLAQGANDLMYISSEVFELGKTGTKIKKMKKGFFSFFVFSD